MATLRLACLGLLACACTKRWSAEGVQPRLILAGDQDARTSVPLTIAMRDMDTGRYVLRNTAYYVFVSRDRLRFHVTLHHKWDDIADLETWSAYVEDETGRRLYPEEMSVSVRPVTTWRRGPYTYVLHRPMYRGTADFTIYERDLFEAGGRMTLVLERPGLVYRYRWISGPAGDPDSSDLLGE